MKTTRIIADPYCPSNRPVYGTRYGGGIIESFLRRLFNHPTAHVPVFYRVETDTEIQLIMSPKNAAKAEAALEDTNNWRT